jgi:hypothetical protein
MWYTPSNVRWCQYLGLLILHGDVRDVLKHVGVTSGGRIVHEVLAYANTAHISKHPRPNLGYCHYKQCHSPSMCRYRRHQ